MIQGLFNSLPIGFVYVGTVAFIVVFFEIGYQIGKYVRSRYHDAAESAQGAVMSGVLAMLAFVLAFTFSMAASRFELKKQNLLAEVNAINMAYLRADFLAEPHQAEVRRLLKEYVDMRIAGVDKAKREMAIARSLELHQLLWTRVVSVANENPNALNASVVQSISEIINMHEKRVAAALRDRIPGNIWLMLYAITAFGMITMGAQNGLANSRRLIQVIPTWLAFAALITLVVDLDRPSDVGLITLSQEAMVDLQSRLKSGVE